jgi:hypothetical protein
MGENSPYLVILLNVIGGHVLRLSETGILLNVIGGHVLRLSETGNVI